MSGDTGLTGALARYAARATFEDLPDAVRHESKRALVNWLGVAIGGCDEGAVATAAQTVARMGASPQATVIGHGLRCDVANAAFVNCIASSVLAYDDAHLPTVAHPSGPAVASAFALAQARAIRGPDFLNAIALSIEVQCRVATMLVAPPAPMDSNFYVNGLSGPIGVAAGAGRLLGLDSRRMAWALGIAASQAGGFRAVHGTMTSHFRPGHATRAGIHAALLANDGLDCIDDALEAPGGFIDVFAKGSDPALAMAALGSRHDMLENRYKPYPCGIVIHPVIDACREVRAQLPDGDKPARVRLVVNPLVLRMTGKRSPRTALESHVSVFHWAAVALLQDAVGLAATGEECLSDGSVAALRDRIEADASENIGKGEAVVEVVLGDGRAFSAHVNSARGSRERPMSDNELDTKFMDLATRRLAPDAAMALRDACWRVDSVDDVGSTLGPLVP